MATLSIVEGPAQGERFALERHRLVMVGRDATCTFQIVDEHISRKHLQIALEEETGDHYAIDVGSANGVVLNGAAISPRSRHLLQDGFEVQIGETVIVYSASDDPEAIRAMEGARQLRAGHAPTMPNVSE